MKYLLNKPRIVGMYLSEYGNIYNDMNKRTFINKDEFAGYIPVLNLFSINSNEDVKFADGLNKDNEIVSYNRAISSQKLGPTIARKKKLDVTHNDLVGLLSRLPGLRLVAFNGRTAARVAQQLTHLPFTLLQLPSSSPAYTLPYPVKLDQWKRIVGYL